MKISSLQLQAFYQLAQDKSFTKAADKLAITQSAFSHRILNLEGELEATLFTREKHNVHLTDTGELLLRYCEKIFRMESELLTQIKSPHLSGELAGTIRIGGFSSVLRSCVLPAMQGLLRENPRLSLSIHSVELSELMNLLKTSMVDLVLSNREPQNQKIEAHFMGYEENVLVESSHYSFDGNYLDHDSQDVTTSSYFKLKPELAEGAKKRYLDDVYGLLDGVKLGMGRAVLPIHLIKGQKNLKILFPKTRLKVPVYLLFYRNAFQTKLEQKVIATLFDYFKKVFAR